MIYAKNLHVKEGEGAGGGANLHHKNMSMQYSTEIFKVVKK